MASDFIRTGQILTLRTNGRRHWRAEQTAVLRKMISSGAFRSKRAMARAMGCDETTISRHIKEDPVCSRLWSTMEDEQRTYRKKKK